MKWDWLWKLTRGYPMIFHSEAVMDVVFHKPINIYMDRNGKFWMASTEWSFKRVPLRGQQIQDLLFDRRVEDIVKITTFGHGGGGGSSTVEITTGGVAGHVHILGGSGVGASSAGIIVINTQF